MTDLAAIKSATDCREVFAHEFPNHFRPHGNSLCPWHDDRTPSLQVEHDHVFCHAEGRRFDVFDILQRARACDFREAQHILGRSNGNNSEHRTGQRRESNAGKEGKDRKAFPSLDAAVQHFQPIATYRYRHADGSLDYVELKVKTERREADSDTGQVRTVTRKVCYPIHEEADGTWYLDLQNVKRTLFGLPELLESDSDSWVVFAEGARDAQTAQRLGFVAVTSGSSGSLGAANRDGALESLRNRKVALFADRDKAGETMEEKAREILPEIVRELRICRIPNPEQIKGFDLSDYVQTVGEDDAYGLIMELIEDTRPEPVKEEQKPQNKRTTPVTISFHDLSEAEIEEPRMIVDQILSEGLALWCGAPKSCKSWQMIQMATAVSQGGLFLGEFRCTQGDVLCLSLEDNERRLAKRLKMQLQGDPAPRNAYLATQWPMFRETKKNEIDGLGHLHRFIENNPETRLVIIDTLAKVRQRRKKEGNLYGQDYEDLEQLQQMASSYGIAIVLVHHTNKGQHQDEFNTISGSTGLSGCADTIAILRKPRGATEGELFISGRDVEEIRGALSFDPDTGLWTWNGTVAEAKSSQEREEILEAMKAVGLPMKPKDVHEKLSGTRTLNAIQQAMTRMRASGQLETSAKGKGWYVVAPPPFPTH